MINVGCDAATTEQAIARGRVARRHLRHGRSASPRSQARRRHRSSPYLDDPNVVAVGECGLDYYYDHSPRDAQRDAFAAQIHLANERSLPLVIHTRDAWADTFDILDAEGVPERTIFHCFTGGPDEARQCIERNAYLSLQRHRHVQDGDRLARGGAAVPARSNARRDRQPVPRTGPAPRPAQPACVRRARGRCPRRASSCRPSTTFALLPWTNACLAFPGIRP